MRIVKCIFTAVLVFLMLITSSLAESEVVVVKETEDFRLQKFEVISDRKILAYGSIGELMNYKGAIYIIDSEGNSTDFTPPEDTLEGMYRDGFLIDENAMIALRSVPNQNTWRVARLEDGGIIWSTKDIENVFSLDRVDDRFLMYCKPEPVTAEIRCMDFDGNNIWKIRLEERILLEGILIGDKMHIAYGSKMEDPIGNKDQRSTSLVFAFSNEGDILWRYDGKKLGYSTEFIDAVWSNDGKPILIGIDRVCKYDKNGEVWAREYASNGMTGIVSTDSGYLISYHYHRQKGMRFIKVDESGEMKEEFFLKDIPSGTEKIFVLDGEPHMMVYHPTSGGSLQLVKIAMR